MKATHATPLLPPKHHEMLDGGPRLARDKTGPTRYQCECGMPLADRKRESYALHAAHLTLQRTCAYCGAYQPRHTPVSGFTCTSCDQHHPDEWPAGPSDPKPEPHAQTCRCDRCWQDARDGYGP